MRRRLVVGFALVAAYVVAVCGTVALRSDHTRPLYDSFVPPSSYRFVDPPAFFASGNVKPTATSATIALRPRGSAPVGLATPDGQFVINLARGAIPAVAGATAVSIRITPIAPRDLSPVPGGLRANGNAYRLDVTYEPHGQAVTRFARPGTLVVEIPEVGRQLFVAPDAKSWSSLPVRVFSPSGLTMAASLAAPGYYVAGTNLPELASPAGHRSHVAIIVGIVVAAFAVLIFLLAYVVARKRRRTASGALD